MRTATNIHLRVTMADRCYSMPVRLMPKNDWNKYLRFLMRNAGFDASLPITVKGTAFDQIFSQAIA